MKWLEGVFAYIRSLKPIELSSLIIACSIAILALAKACKIARIKKIGTLEFDTSLEKKPARKMFGKRTRKVKSET